MNNEARAWAEREFGRAKLGDIRNEQRLLQMAACVANHSSGKVSEVFRHSAQLQGAYDFLENERVRSADIARAVATTTAERCRQHPYIFMPEDGSSITLTDRLKSKGLGPIGTTQAKARGLKMINCIAIDPQGVPLGLLAQKWWVRSNTPIGKKKTHNKRKTNQKETQHWLDAEQYARDIFAAEKIDTRIWTQKDREADSWPQILDALAHSATQWTTIRASWNRRLKAQGAKEEPSCLWQHIDGQEVGGATSSMCRKGKIARRGSRTCKCVFVA
jgi:transposase-like protein